MSSLLITPQLTLRSEWNKFCQSVDRENPILKELEGDYHKYDPGRVVLTPDIRGAQRQRHVTQLKDSIKLHTEQTGNLKAIKDCEERF